MKPDKSSVFTRSESDEDRLGRFIGGSSVSVVSSVLAGVFALAWAALMTRELDKEQYGILGPFLQCFWISTTVISFGLPHTLITFISHHGPDEFDAARRVAVQGNKLLFVVGAAIVLPAAAVLCLLWATGVVENLWSALGLILCFAVMARQMFFGAFASLAGMQRIELASLANILFSILLPFVSLFLLYTVRRAVPGSWNAEILAGAGGIGVAAALAFMGALVVVSRTPLKPRVLYAFREPLTDTRRILGFGATTNIVVVGYTVVTMIPPIFMSYVMAHGLGWFGATESANAAAAGVFSCAFTYAMAPMMVMGMTFALIPAMSEAEAQGAHDLLNRYFNTSIKYCVSLLSLITAVYAVVIGKFVSLLTGGEYAAAQVHGVTLRLEMSLAAAALFVLFLSMLVGLKRPAVAARMVCVILVLELAAMALAGRFTGRVETVAEGIIAALALGIIAALAYFIRRVGLSFRWFMLFPPAASAALTWAAGTAIAKHAGILYAMPVAPVIFFAADGLLGGIDRQDLGTVRDTLRSLKLGALTFALDLAEKIFSLSPLFPKETEHK